MGTFLAVRHCILLALLLVFGAAGVAFAWTRSTAASYGSDVGSHEAHVPNSTINTGSGPMSGAPSATPERSIDTPLLVRSRDRLAICVQPISGVQLTADLARSRISDALDELSATPNWDRHGWRRLPPPRVNYGCPADPYLLRSGIQHVRGHIVRHPGGLTVTQASEYYLFVFVLPPEDIESIFQGNESAKGGRVIHQEAMRLDGSLIPVTHGLYISSLEIDDPPQLKRWLERGLNLVPPGR